MVASACPSTVQTAKGAEYIAASAPDTHHEAIIDLGKNLEPGGLRNAEELDVDRAIKERASRFCGRETTILEIVSDVAATA